MLSAIMPVMLLFPDPIHLPPSRSTFSLVTALLVVFLRDQLGPSTAGLALMYTTSMAGMFQFTSRLIAEAEARFTAVERISNYIETLPQEAPPTSPQDPEKSWPPVCR